MLDEFILEQLDKIELEYQELNRSLEDLNNDEREIQHQMDDYLSSQDLGIELFSPRSAAGPLREKMSDLQKHLEEIHLSQMDVTDRIARNREKEEKYQIYLNESRMKGLEESKEEKISDIINGSLNNAEVENGSANGTKKNSEDCQAGNNVNTVELEKNPQSKKKTVLNNNVEEFKEILSRVDRCINLVNHDRTKCKNELKNMRYYLKALISEATNDSEE